VAKSRIEVPAGFAKVHAILGVAMRVTDPATWPTPPHLGGPLPILAAATQLGIGVRIAPHARAFANDPRAFDALVDLAARVRDGARPARDALDAGSKRRKEEPGLQVARLVARAAYNFVYSAKSARNVIGLCVENAAALTAQLVGELEAVRGYLAALDAAIVEGEIKQLLEARAISPSSAVARVIARAGDGERLGCVVARLEDARFGVFAKIGSRWQWHEGERGTAAAMVPDRYLEEMARVFEE
jgi:hypothetical protein